MEGDADMACEVPAYRALTTLSFVVHKTAPVASQKVQFGAVIANAHDETLQKKRMASRVGPRTRMSINRLQAEDYFTMDLSDDSVLEGDLLLTAETEPDDNAHKDDESVCGAFGPGSVAISTKSYTADSRSYKSLQRSAVHAAQFSDHDAMAPVTSANAVVAAIKAKTRLMADLDQVQTLQAPRAPSMRASTDQSRGSTTSPQLSSSSLAPTGADQLLTQLQSALTAPPPKYRAPGSRRSSTLGVALSCGNLMASARLSSSGMAPGASLTYPAQATLPGARGPGSPLGHGAGGPGSPMGRGHHSGSVLLDNYDSGLLQVAGDEQPADLCSMPSRRRVSVVCPPQDAEAFRHSMDSPPVAAKAPAQRAHESIAGRRRHSTMGPQQGSPHLHISVGGHADAWPLSTSALAPHSPGSPSGSGRRASMLMPPSYADLVSPTGSPAGSALAPALPNASPSASGASPGVSTGDRAPVFGRRSSASVTDDASDGYAKQGPAASRMRPSSRLADAQPSLPQGGKGAAQPPSLQSPKAQSIGLMSQIHSWLLGSEDSLTSINR